MPREPKTYTDQKSDLATKQADNEQKRGTTTQQQINSSNTGDVFHLATWLPDYLHGKKNWLILIKSPQQLKDNRTTTETLSVYRCM